MVVSEHIFQTPDEQTLGSLKKSSPASDRQGLLRAVHGVALLLWISGSGLGAWRNHTLKASTAATASLHTVNFLRISKFGVESSKFLNEGGGCS